MTTLSKIKYTMYQISLGFLMCSAGLSAAAAATFQSHKSIYDAAQSYARNHIVTMHKQRPIIKVGKLDSRLRLKKCGLPLYAFLPKGSREIGKTTVGIKCTDSKPWSLHVPVTISIFKNVLVAAHLLEKGDILTATDTKLIRHDLSDLSYGYLLSKSSGIGKKVKRRVLAGSVLTPNMLKKPQLIARGQKVAILAKSGQMEVRMMGKALDNGAMGDRIKVLNLKSRRKLEGVVISSATVKVEI